MATTARKTTKTATAATPKGRVVASKIVKPVQEKSTPEVLPKRRPGVKTAKEKAAAVAEANKTAGRRVFNAVVPKTDATNAAAKKLAEKDGKVKVPVWKDTTKAAKKPAKADTVTFRGFVIPVKRKSTDSEDNVPTISVKNVAETIKLFEKLPKGCTWLTDTSAATKDTLNLYNKSGAYIAEVRITK